MTTIRHNSVTKWFYFLATLLIGSSMVQSCSRKINFQNSSVVPAAEGKVKLKKDKNNNYNIDLNVMRLADPSRLTPPKNVYVVWMETERNGTKNIGQLKTSSGLITNVLKSSLTTVTPFKPVRIFITAEDDANPSYPDRTIILNTSDF